MSFFLYQIPTVPKIWHRMFCCVILSHASWMAISVSLAANNWFLLRKAFIWWKQSSQVFKCGEYGGWKRRFTPYLPRRSLKALSVNLPWWNGQLSITPFKENRTTPPRYFHSFLKENQEFVTVGSAFEYIYKIDSQTGMQKIYCKSCIGCRSLDLKGGSPGYWIFVSSVHCSFCNTCLVEKVDCTDNQITDLIKKEVRRASISAVLDSDGTAWIFFFVISSSFLTNLVIVLGWGKSAGWRTPSNTSLFCNSEV